MTALVTYMYPNAIHFFDEFSLTIKQQTDSDFEVIFFNDGVDEKLFQKAKYKHQIITIQGSPLEIRFKSFEILKTLPFEKYIFLDSDDTMSNNRVEILKEKLISTTLICNDLNLMDSKGKLFEKKIWSNRLPEGFSFEYSFLKDKNIVGLGNTAFRRELLETPLIYSAKALIADWFIFYQLLKQSALTCTFTSICQTNYRQHNNNDAGIKETTEERLNYVVKVTNQQYSALKEIKLDNFFPIDVQFNYRKIDYKHNFPFWWEEITINNANI